METTSYQDKTSLIQQELNELENEPVLLDGKLIKPSQCYRLSGTPPHVLYNTNCPEHLMDKIEAILLKHQHTNENIS